MEIPYAENILEISGIGERVLTGMLAEMGDVFRFDDAKEIQKLSGLGLVACSSGKNKGETKISHRGRKWLRYWLFQTAKSAGVHSEEFKELNVYYTIRQENPLINSALPIRMVSKNQLQTRAVAGTQCMNRWDEGSWDTIPLDTEGSLS